MQDTTHDILAEGSKPRAASPAAVADANSHTVSRLLQSRPLQRFASGRSALLLALGFSCMAAAFGFVPGAAPDPHPTTTLQRTLELPSLLPRLDALDDAPYWVEERIQRGDTIGNILSRAGMRDAQAMTFLVSDPAARPLYRLRPGRSLRLALDAEGRLQALRLLASENELFTMSRDGEALKVEMIAPQREVRREERSGEIVSSLFGAADTAGIPDAVTIAMADVLGGDIDFYHDLRRGDRFSVMYERVFVEGELVNSGRILAVEFTNGGIVYDAYWWKSPEGDTGYYNAKGESSRKAFLRAPLEFSRISSNFSPARLHPLFKSKRAHTGTDYAAPTGTPVRAAGDGTVDFAGQQGGYGNLVILRHAGKVTTYYAHMSRFAKGLSKGDRVAQGTVIGYVGQTGWATGPHLHYEFRVANVPKDPLKSILPPAAPIAAQHKKAFGEHVAQVRERLQLARDNPESRRAALD